jgi:protein involved in polysaccharide export with SLBB domain
MLSVAAAPFLPLLAQATGAAEPPPAYRVGPGDVIEVQVEGRPDLSRMPTVQTTGSIWLPRAGDVEVLGLTTGEIAARVAAGLAGEDLPAPQVAVRVTGYHSQFVWVQGAVNRPGRKPLRAGTRLVDALLDAGGFQAGASGELVVTRSNGTFADGSKAQHFKLKGKDPTPEELERLGLPLVAGDRVSASVQRFVGVTGAVQHPGQYAYEDSLTLGALVELAGGLLRSASDHVVLRRDGAEREVDLGAVRKGHTPDVALQPGDEIVVRARRL